MLDRRRTTGPCPPDVADLLVATPLGPPVPGRPVAWWALDDEGRDVVVQRVRPPGGPGGVDEASLRRRLAHPHVAPLLRVVRCREGAVQVLGPVTGGSLSDVLAERDLRAGEVITLVAGLGSALEALHEEGFAHGELSAAGVLVDAAGMPLLLGLGAARPSPPPGRAQRRRELRGTGPAWGRPEDDVRDLARLALASLGGTASAGPAVVPTLVDLLAGVAHAPAGRAPSATQLARACWTLAPAEAVGTAAVAGPEGRPSGTAITQRVRRVAARAADHEGRRQCRGPARRVLAAAWRLPRWTARRPSRAAVAATGAGAVLAVAAVVALVLVPSGGSSAGSPAAGSPVAEVVGAAATTAPSSTPPSTPPTTRLATSSSPPSPSSSPVADPRLRGDDPAAAVRALAELRVRAIVSGQVTLLDAVDVPGSPASAADAAVLASLDGSRVEGLTVDVVSAAVEERSGDEARVAVVTATSAYRLDTGSDVVEVPAGSPVTSRLTLLRGDGGWRVVDDAS